MSGRDCFIKEMNTFAKDVTIFYEISQKQLLAFTIACAFFSK